ncbi:MAG: hypothetical protein HZA49_00825 [Planctomycetes bacterium]|nr:hypothetical protein [Planctomycetota bacterium]
MMPNKNIAIVFITVAVLVFLAAGPAWPLTVELKNGSYLTGEIISSDDQGFELKSWPDNGIVRLKWQHLSSAEADRMKKMLAISSLAGDSYNIDATRVYLKSGQIYEGVTVEKSAAQLRLKTLTGIKNVVLSDAVRVDPVKINPLKVYTAQEWYVERAKTADPKKASDNFELAEYCKTFLKLYDKAREHYRKAAELADSYKARAAQKIAELDQDVSRSRETEIEGLIANKDAKSLEQAKNLLAEWRKEGSPLSAETEKSIRRLEDKLREAEKTLDDKSQKDSAKKIAQQYYASMKALVKKTSGQDLTYQDANAYVNTMLFKLIVDKLVKDTKMTEERITAIINDRSPGKYADLPKYEASYGEGSWIISAEEQAPPASMSPEEYAKYQKRVKAVADARDKAVQKNELIAPEQWWAKANEAQKETFLEALFAERYMYVIERKSTPCATCNGEGISNKNLCKRCWGAMNDISVVYK